MNILIKKTILLVDDEVIVVKSNSQIIKRFGYEVLTAFSSKEALNIIMNNMNIDLILMDISLGQGTEGIDTAEAILKDRDIPIVFLSNHSESDIIEKTERITSYGYLIKGSSDRFIAATIKMAFKLFEANQKVKATKDKLEATLNALPDLMFEIGEDGTYYDYHSPFTELLYKPVSEIIGKKIQEVLPAEITEIVMSAIQEAKEKGFSVGKQFEMNVPAGTLWFELSIARKGNNPMDSHFIVLKRDITKRKDAEDKIKSLLAEKEIILKEAHHRIKNNMVTMMGLLDLQANALKDPVAIKALNEASSRMHSMGLLYDKLYRSENPLEVSIIDYLSPLVDEILGNFNNSLKIKVEKNIEDFILHAKILQPLGIIVNELLTNIMKYAFIGRDDGVIIVNAFLKMGTNGTKNIASIEIYDNGIGIPESIDFKNSTGFGLTLIRLLTKQIEGSIQVERKNGTKILLEFEIKKEKIEWNG